MLANPIATVSINLPRDIFDDIEVLADEAHVSSVDIIKIWLKRELEHRAWVNDWQALKTQVNADGGLNIGHTSEQIVAQMRQTRRELWDAEYAHLYR